MICSIFGNNVDDGSMGADFYHFNEMFVRDYIQRLTRAICCDVWDAYIVVENEGIVLDNDISSQDLVSRATVH